MSRSEITTHRPGGTESDDEYRRPQKQKRNLMSRFGLLLAWAIVFLFFSLLPATSGVFLSFSNLSTILGSQAVIAVLTLALVPTLTVGDFDLSVAFTLTLSAMIIAVLNVQHDWAIVPAILVAVLAGVVVGAVNAFIVIYFRIHSLIVTLGTGTVIGGIVLWMSDATTISGISPALVNWVIVERVFRVPIAFYYVLFIGVVMWYIFEMTPGGQRMLIVGRGRIVARLSGIRVERVRVLAFVASGAVSAIGGVIYAGTTGAADPTSGTDLLLPAFAAAFLGSTTIYPGRFNPLGALAAVFFLVTGITGFQLLGAQSYVQSLFYGGALVLAVVLSQLARNRQELESGGG